MAEFYGVQTGSAEASPSMIRVIRICRKCGAKIFSDAPEGLCSRCVLKAALGNFVNAPVAAGDSSTEALGTPKPYEGGSAKADDPGHVDKSACEGTKTACAA